MADMRIGGLASGMDIDSIVGDLMKAERMPLNKLKQEKQILEWKREDYRSINTLLLDFRSTLTQMKLTTQYRARNVSSTNEANLTATASSAASQSSYSISNVTQLASAAVLKNAGKLTDVNATEKVDATKGLYNQKDSFASSITWKQGMIENKTITASTASDVIQLGVVPKTNTFDDMNIKVDGRTFKAVAATEKTQGELATNEVLVDTSGNLTFKTGVIKQGSIVKAEFIVDNKTDSKTVGDTAINNWQLAKGSINSLSITLDGTTYSTGTGAENEIQLIQENGTNVIGTLNRETGKITFNQEIAAGTQIETTYDQNYSSFSLGAHTSKGETYENFLVAGNTSLNNVISKVNSSNVGLTMFYDSYSDQMTLSRKETGDFLENGSEIITSGDFVNTLLQFSGGQETGGENLLLNINGLTTQRTSNTFEMTGVTFTVKQKFTEATSINVSNDTNQVFENIKSFVEKYNELIGKINDKLSEEKYRDYAPLTDQQRETLSDKQQEQWEEKARSGLLRRDSALSGALSGMRMDFYSSVSNHQVSSVYNQLASIGITTSSNYMEGGKLQINEAKLKAAIEADPTSVENLFRGDGNNYSEKGIMHRLTDTVNSTMDKLKERAGNTFSTNQQFTLGRQLDSVDDQIRRFEDRLIQVEDRYWRQFTAMEKAIQRANSQSMYLMQQFNSGY